jgi:hypothetical protein
MYILGFDLLRVERYHLLYMEVDFEKEGVGVIRKILLLFCKFSDFVYLDGGFLCSQRSACAPLFVHSLCLLSLMEYLLIKDLSTSLLANLCSG